MTSQTNITTDITISIKVAHRTAKRKCAFIDSASCKRLKSYNGKCRVARELFPIKETVIITENDIVFSNVIIE